MPAITLETKQHAHDLLDQLGPGQLAAIVSLLEVMIREEENITEEDRRAVSASREYFRRNPQGVLLSKTSLPNAASPWIRSATSRTTETK